MTQVLSISSGKLSLLSLVRHVWNNCFQGSLLEHTLRELRMRGNGERTSRLLRCHSYHCRSNPEGATRQKIRSVKSSDRLGAPVLLPLGRQSAYRPPEGGLDLGDRQTG